MSKRIIIIGAVALGPKVACRLRRLDPDAQITVIDRDSLISYGGCGIPYYVGGDVADLEGLFSTIAHAVRDASFFEAVKGVNVITRAEATSIDRREKKVTIRHLNDGNREEDLSYDTLVLATGASPLRPPVPGVDLPGVYTVSNLHEAKAIKESIQKGEVENSVVIGAGAIGIEMAEAMSDLWGVETTLIEMADRVLPAALSRNMAQIAKQQMEENDIRVLTSQRVMKINGDPETGVTSIETENETVPCNLVVLSAGVRPNAELAREAGLAIGRCGGILVDPGMRTSDPSIYAGGDCVEVVNQISKQSTIMPLGSLANRQGRIIATNILGGCEQFKGTVGTFCIKVFEMGFAKAGLTVDQARNAGYDAVHTIVTQFDRAHFYPDSNLMYMKLIADKRTRKVLGVEAAGYQGDSVKARVDTVAALLPLGVDVCDICTVETAYSPPYSSAMDIVNNAANSLDNMLDGHHVPVDALDFLEEFNEKKTRVLDVRSKVQAGPFVEKYGDQWMNIPQDELRSRIEDVPKDEDFCLICGSGPRSYEAQLVLAAHGITRTRNIQGGYGMLLAVHPPLVEDHS